MGGPKRSAAQRGDDCFRMLRFIERGYTQMAIARELGISHQQVSFDYKRLVRQSMENRTGAREAVETKLLELEMLKREALDAWERSKNPAVETIDVNGDMNSSYTEKKKGQCGDPKYLQVVAECIKQERALRGLDAPKEMQITGQMTSVNVDWSAFLDLDGHDRNLVEERMKLLLEGKPLPPEKVSGGSPLYSKGEFAPDAPQFDPETEFPPYEEPESEEVDE